MSLLNESFVFRLILLVVLAASAVRYSVAARDLAAAEPPPYHEDALIKPNPITHVTVYNYLDGKSFTIHCKSGDDDLGTHEIAPGKYYTWQFRVNIFVTTLFFCGVSWEKGHGVYDVYVAKRDLLRCPTECIWKVKTKALIGYNDWLEPDEYFRWS